MNLIPTKDRIIVKLEPYKVSEIIHYPETGQSLCPNQGIVKFVGENGQKLGVKPGDKVLVEMFTGQMNVDFEGEEVKMLKTEHILGILEEIV